MFIALLHFLAKYVYSKLPLYLVLASQWNLTDSNKTEITVLQKYRGDVIFL